MSKHYEELSRSAQVALEDLRHEILRSKEELNLELLEKDEKGYHAFLGFCAGFMRGRGCSLSDSTSAVAFAKSKDFWLPRIEPTIKQRIDQVTRTVDYDVWKQERLASFEKGVSEHIGEDAFAKIKSTFDLETSEGKEHYAKEISALYYELIDIDKEDE